MSAEAKITVRCDQCKKPAVLYLVQSINTARSYLHQKGWLYFAGADYCSACAAKLKEGK